MPLYSFFSMPMGHWGKLCNIGGGAKVGRFTYCLGASITCRKQRGA